MDSLPPNVLNSPPNSPGFFGGLSDLITSMKNLVISANTINQTLAKVFPSWTAGQIPGTTTNGNATAGNVGEDIESVIASGSAVSLVTATAKTVTSISLTGGDWDVWGAVAFNAAGTTTITNEIASISTTTNTLSGLVDGSQVQLGNPGTGTLQTVNVGELRVPLSSTTIYYLVAQSTFATSTMTAYGFIRARRRR